MIRWINVDIVRVNNEWKNENRKEINHSFFSDQNRRLCINFSCNTILTALKERKVSAILWRLWRHISLTAAKLYHIIDKMHRNSCSLNKYSKHSTSTQLTDIKSRRNGLAGHVEWQRNWNSFVLWTFVSIRALIGQYYSQQTSIEC